MIDIRPLRYFVALAETRHFGRAAVRLNITQPPLSRQIAALEEALDVTLIERTSRSVELTAAGRRFHEDAKAILAAVAQAAANARAAAQGGLGTLSVGFTMCAAYSVVPKYARLFSTAWPDVELNLREIVSNDLAAQVHDGRIDAAIMFPAPLAAGMSSRTIFSEPLCIALSRSHPRARARRLDIAQLAGEPFIMASADSAPSLRQTIVDHCRSGGFEPDVRLEVQLQQTILTLVDEGVGVALVPSSMRKAQLAGVAFVPLQGAPTVDLVLVWSEASRNPCLASFLSLQ
ncbi:MAG TPA: LysR family transcriptional regulator [Rhodocyclaceae bacterium]|nr:LysR family transcriptional regulator [Rhodocyclaceae bacterium]